MEDYFKNLQYVSSNDECLENYTDSLSTPNKIPKVFYHYTSIEAFKGIINNKKLWLTNSKYFNDPSEVDYGFNYISKQIPNQFKNNQYLKDSFNTWKSSFDANLEHRYVCCFSKNYDYLPLWSMYTGNKGLCIEFERNDKQLEKFKTVKYDISELEARLNNIASNIMSFFPDEKQIIREQMDTPFEDIDIAPSLISQLQNQVDNWLGIYLHNIYLQFKCKAYEYENEIRLILSKDDLKSLNAVTQDRFKGNTLISYAELDFTNFLQIKSVCLAPGCNSLKLKEDLIFYLRERNLCNSKGYKNGTEFVKESTIPFRNF